MITIPAAIHRLFQWSKSDLKMIPWGTSYILPTQFLPYDIEQKQFSLTFSSRIKSKFYLRINVEQKVFTFYQLFHNIFENIFIDPFKMQQIYLIC